MRQIKQMRQSGARQSGARQSGARQSLDERVKTKKGGAGTVVLVTLAVIVFIALMIVFWVMGAYNGLVQTDVGVGNSWANVQTAYERRLDLIPNLVATVQGSADFEKSTQTQIAALRSGVQNAKTASQLGAAGSQANALIGAIMVQVEAYPQLTSTANFRALQDELAGTENRIKYERDNYNKAVAQYQIKLRSFPTNIIAGMFGFQLDKWDMFKAEESAANPPKVDFDFNNEAS